MAPTKGLEMEQEVVDEVSAEELMKHTAFIAEPDFCSGKLFCRGSVRVRPGGADSAFW